MEKIVRLEHVCFSYDKTSKFIEDISLEILKGSYTCIVGPNGSGKTTLSLLIAGLLNTDKGNVFIDGIIMNNDSMDEIRNHLGVIFQNPDNQYVGTTLKDDIIFGLENHNINPTEMDEIVNRVAGECGVTDLLDKEPSSMSGGQKQKGAIAGILALNPSILILDEATSMLDPVSKRELNELIFKMKQEKNLTIISITHDREELLYADHVIVLDGGKIAYDGEAKKFFSLDYSGYNVELPRIIELEKALGYSEFVTEEEFFRMAGDKHED